ncbi:MAG: hypothetical protein KJO40_07455 [Deltaproteobacteria bacterium]|nr:hypothetical protein [Deltaproteobacteria bacterium]MBT8466001.1 hypothetical protein [Deltaproteobacteria bacterium]NNK44188.1 hypothetical protein [Myxococcales bacterium]
MAKPSNEDNTTPLNSVGRVLDSRWMMAFAVLSVLVAIAWALLESDPRERPIAAPESTEPMSTVELLGVPPGAEILLDGRKIENSLFGVTPGTRHALEVSDAQGRTWRQVFLAKGSLSLIVELRTQFIEVEVSPKGASKKSD